MQYIFGAGLIYLVGTIVENRKQTAHVSRNSGENYVNTNDYIRDDYADDLKKFDPDFGLQDIKAQGAIIGDYESHYGPDERNEHPFFDPMNWHNYNAVPIEVPHHYGL
jgi:hypothetical protein